MKTSAMITMAAMLAGSTWAATKSDGEKLVACIERGNYAGVAEVAAKASSLFLSADVKLDWHGELRFCQGQLDSIVVSFRESTPRAFHPGALAYALPYEGVHIQVFYDRIAQADPRLVPSLMAQVIVHEITHILQGIDRHSASGIITALDVVMIHDGFTARTARNAAGTLVATVAP
jgi:hypothetical protein